MNPLYESNEAEPYRQIFGYGSSLCFDWDSLYTCIQIDSEGAFYEYLSQFDTYLPSNCSKHS